MRQQMTDWGDIYWMEEENETPAIGRLRTGIVTVRPGKHQPPHIHYEEQVIYVLEGEAENTVDGRAERITAGDLYHWKEGIIHEIRNMTDRPFRHLLISNPSLMETEASFTEEANIEAENLPPDLIYIAAEAVRTQFLETLPYGYALFDTAGNLVLQSSYFPEYCRRQCSPQDHVGECPCMARSRNREFAREQEFQCEYGMEVYQYPIRFAGRVLGYIQGGYIRLSGIAKGTDSRAAAAPGTAAGSLGASGEEMPVRRNGVAGVSGASGEEMPIRRNGVAGSSGASGEEMPIRRNGVAGSSGVNGDALPIQVYDAPESVVTGVKALLWRIVRAIRNYCEFEQFRAELTDRELQISSARERQNILLKDLQDAQYEMTDLKINNHFLFNTLNSMAAMALEGGMVPLYQSIVDLSKMFHYTLRTTSSVVTLRRELDYVKAYVQLQKLRYAQALHAEIKSAPGLDELQVPFNFLQPVAENAFTHGFHEEPEKYLRIEAAEAVDMVRIRILNSGKVLSEQEYFSLNQAIAGNTSHGLSMVARKLRAVYGEHCRIRIGAAETEKGVWERAGSVVEIHIPRQDPEVEEEKRSETAAGSRIPGCTPDRGGAGAGDHAPCRSGADMEKRGVPAAGNCIPDRSGAGAGNHAPCYSSTDMEKRGVPAAANRIPGRVCTDMGKNSGTGAGTGKNEEGDTGIDADREEGQI